MGVVHKFEPRKAGEEPEDPHYTGQALCLACGHEWVAVQRVGTLAAMPAQDRTALQCPVCTACRGVLLHHVIYSKCLAFACGACQGQLFTIILAGDGGPCTACAACGTLRNAMDLFDAR